METLIDEIHNIIKDYRSDELFGLYQASPNRIKRWINQFAEVDREFILQELKSILLKQYCSKEEAKRFLKKIIEKLSTDLGYKMPGEFLENAVFLDLQDTGKSQKKMLELLDNLLKSDYATELSKCGNKSRKHFIYLDDILCTGNTLFQDIKDWCSLEFAPGKTNLQALKDGSANLIFTYVFIHSKNYWKKVSEFGWKIDTYLENGHKMYFMHEMDNSFEETSTYDVILPHEDSQPQEVIDYKTKIVNEVDSYTDGKGWKRSGEEFYRPADKPQKESLFSTTDNRRRFESIILQKGIDILSKVTNPSKNMRALGYSLPSQKNFGFGTLCFTWRNVANNTPLVFWYAGGGFFPLFEKR